MPSKVITPDIAENKHTLPTSLIAMANTPLTDKNKMNAIHVLINLLFFIGVPAEELACKGGRFIERKYPYMRQLSRVAIIQMQRRYQNYIISKFDADKLLEAYFL